jgi:hypothetical protein
MSGYGDCPLGGAGGKNSEPRPAGERPLGDSGAKEMARSILTFRLRDRFEIPPDTPASGGRRSVPLG